ncbi:hypothetical protein ACFT8W_17635 [Streptomyces hygroscopicus]|uniref:hypothetical protein n=1 Tax=Streptomyces hygroscopicus TaxID=1912 RepID=UPI00362D159C
MYRMARERVRWPAVADRARESSAAPWPPFWTAGTRRADLADQATDEQISAVRRARATRVRRLKKDLEASQRERYADVTQPEAPQRLGALPADLEGRRGFSLGGRHLFSLLRGVLWWLVGVDGVVRLVKIVVVSRGGVDDACAGGMWNGAAGAGPLMRQCRCRTR